MREELDIGPYNERRGGILGDIDGRVTDITARLPYPHETHEELLESDFTIICAGSSDEQGGVGWHLLKFGFGRPPGAAEGSRPVPQIERLDSEGEFRGFAVTDTLMLDGDRVVDAHGEDRGEAGKERMNEWLRIIDAHTMIQSSSVTSRGRQIWED